VSTRKLVDSVEDQELLEEIVEARKPPLPDHANLHYLLITPFRYPPLAHGSRFGSRRERGIWYGAETIPTGLAEVAYYRLVFLHGSDAALGMLQIVLTAYSAIADTDAGIDLTEEPFSAFRRRISSKTSYRDSQALGRAMRDAGVVAFRYRSARDPGGGACLGVFESSGFARKTQTSYQTWHCFATRDRVEFRRGAFTRQTIHKYEPRDFLVRGRLSAPAV
jgi:hypothetical protein